ncbi:lipase family protein [Dyadobacter sp. CY261]|uniref:lipase family protein n=1 Tax=Dyadobacter sp. CY261 TaxID=2907203 RepID=UPI001F292C45|nr:lipase family protein [Dyadobacter sp. CY261]MCF0073109.1 lipase family protein [Dyadobacter sp. CY261]
MQKILASIKPILTGLFSLATPLLATLLSFEQGFAQSGRLKPGFDKAEYRELIYMHSVLYDTAMTKRQKFKIPRTNRFDSLYTSPVMGLDNRWGLWKNNALVGVINLRGTTMNAIGWLENFYAAMVPARGELQIGKEYTFKYHLADDPKAAVHIGWLVGTAYLARDIIPKIDSLYKTGVKDFLIMGHSQGGALSYLMTAHLYSLQKQGSIPKDIRFKTYASAAPKVGNTYFAYEYEHKVDGGWSYNVINSADWVPEVPFTVQMLSDFNKTNPFKNINSIIKKQKLIARIGMRHAYKGLRKPSEKAQRNYEKYLGNYAGKIVVKNLPEYQMPAYYKSSNYVRTGPTIVLLADEAYYKEFTDSDQQVFVHHGLQPYLHLLEQYKY